MPYQLPQELQTNKFKSLPDDLREIAEAALAEKFDIPEIVKPKKEKKKAEPKSAPPRDWDDRYEYVEIVIQTDEREIVPTNWATQGLGSMSALSQLQAQVNTRYRTLHYNMMIDQNVPHYEIVRQIEYQLRRHIEELKYRGTRLSGDIELWHRGLRLPIRNIRDIEEFVQRSRVGGYGRY